MKATPDRPSVMDLERLERALNTQPVDRFELNVALDRIERALLLHARDIDRAGGLIEEDEAVARPSLDRQADSLRQQVPELAEQVAVVRQQAEAGASDAELLSQARSLCDALQKLRDSEADVAYEGVETDIGSGD